MEATIPAVSVDIVGVGSSSAANSEQMTATNPVATAPCGQAVAIQNAQHIEMAQAAVRADSAAVPWSTCSGFAPRPAMDARTPRVRVEDGLRMRVASSRQPRQESINSGN